MPKPPPESPAPPSRALPPQSLEGLQPAGPEPGGLDRAPIQNSPWKETSLDHPYERPRKSSEPNSESRSGWEEGTAGSRWKLPGMAQAG